MRHSIAQPARGQISGPPLVSLVDLDGGPVPLWEVDAPIVPPFDPDEESDPADWPAWTDNWHWETTEIEAEDLALAAAFDRAMEEQDDAEPLPPLPELHFCPPSPPISGGAPAAFEPSPEDWADYARWSAELDARRDAEEMREWYRRHPVAEFNRLRAD